mmetsp:Transcript_29589/g.70493  ORF Transcript_29589/g.70493 Transcript_29589/m.70493 type:complete len:219 (-) Transcript_29589:4689-5345(-)
MKRKPAETAGAPPAVELQLERVVGLCPRPNCVSHSPCGHDVAYCVGCVAVIFDTRANAQRLFLKAPSAPKPFACVAFSSDGTRLAAGEAGSHPAVIVWDTFTGECLAELRTHKHGVADVCFSPSGQFIASCGTTYDSQLCYWSLQSKSLLAREKTQVSILSRIRSLSPANAVPNRFNRALRRLSGAFTTCGFLHFGLSCYLLSSRTPFRYSAHNTLDC